MKKRNILRKNLEGDRGGEPHPELIEILMLEKGRNMSLR